ncbi:MAG: type VII toxin-antitoxin system MntA family adenylyltransferase antitoxin [Methylococcales bacterium]
MNRFCETSGNYTDERVRQVLNRHPNIRLAFIFGSMAQGRARPDSDLDAAVQAGRPLNVEEKMQLIAELAESLGRPVDLVDLCTVGEPLLGQIISGGRRVLGSDADYARLLNKHVLDQADFMPYRRRILEERRRKWIGP